MSKRAARHLALALIALASVAGGFYLFGLSQETWVDNPGLKSNSLLWRMSMALAYSALFFMTATILIGPVRVLRKGTRSIHIALRRDVAIWAGALGLSHMLVGMFVHARNFVWWSSFVTMPPGPANWLPLRFSRIGLANYFGLLQATIIVTLLLLSNNVALRRLGPARWKGLQRFNYVAFGSITLHGLLYQSVEQRYWAVRLIFMGVVVGVITLQLAGAAGVRRRNPTRAGSQPD